MKKMILCLLAALLLLGNAFADPEDSLFAPYTMTAPRGVTFEEGEISATYVYGNTRVVVMVISRVPDEDAAAALPLLMQQFDPEAVFGDDLPLRSGLVGMKAVNAGKFGEGVDQVTAMVLCDGELLILSGYNTDGDEGRVHELIDALLLGTSYSGEPVLNAEADVPGSTEEAE